MSWSAPLIAGEQVFIADQDGAVHVFELAKEKKLVSREDLGVGVMIAGTPAAANGVLFIAAFNTLFAIAEGASSTPEPNDDE